MAGWHGEMIRYGGVIINYYFIAKRGRSHRGKGVGWKSLLSGLVPSHVNVVK